MGDLREVERLIDDCALLQAHTEALEIGPLRDWRGAHERCVAGRLAWALGGRKLGDALVGCAFREHRSDPEALFYYSYVVQTRRGALGAWEFTESKGELEGASVTRRADWLARRAHLLARLRDFERVEPLLEQALALDPGSAWLRCEQAGVLVEDDRLDEALSAIEEALTMRPDYRPALRHKVEILLELKREDEALALLRDTSGRLEVPALTHALVRQLLERELNDEAEAAVERLAELSPLAEKGFDEYLNGLRSDIAYGQRKFSRAKKFAAAAGKGFFAELSENFKNPPEKPRKVLLDVDFVRQDYVTCAPATLAAIAQYWKCDVDHESLAAEICYDGTPDHVQRHWCEKNGFLAPEFTLSWETALALLDRGIPFTMTTGGATWAHAQAVIGYDSLRRTFSVVDPGSYNTCEYLGREWLEQHASFGPRGMLMMPEREAHRLEGIELPDRELWDLLYRVKRGLHDHDRDAARNAVSELRAAAPQHALTAMARWQMAGYDDHLEGSLKCVDRLLEIHPKEPRFMLAKAGLMASLADGKEHRDFLRAAVQEKDADPIFAQKLAEGLIGDARYWDEAEALLAGVRRRYGAEPSTLSILARLREEQQRYEEAQTLRRFEACLAPMHEYANWGYFQSCRVVGRTQEALRFLERRHEKFGAQRSDPSQTFFEAEVAVGRIAPAFATLNATLKQHPEDWDLVLFAARQAARFGQHEPARKLIARSEGKAKEVDWLGAAAEVARNEGDTVRALELFEKRARLLPFEVDAQRSALQLRASIHGSESAVEFAKAMLDRVPNYLPVQHLGISWLRRDARGDAEIALRSLLERKPSYGWALRELALFHLDAGRAGEAKKCAEQALQLEPTMTSSHSVLGAVHVEQGSFEDARACYARAVELDVDNTAAVMGLVEASRSDQERAASLAHIEAQLERQMVFGDGLAAYRRAARSAVSAQDALRLVDKMRRARPDLWAAWSEMTAQQIETGDLAAALETAREATRRFSMNAEAWFDLASVYRAQGDGDRQIKALERATSLAPASDQMACSLGEAYQIQGRLEEAQQLFEKVVARAPRSAVNRNYLADLLEQRGELRRAIEEVEVSIRLEPESEWAWHRHREWWGRLGQSNASGRLARTLSQERPRDSRVWLCLAEQLTGADQLEERLAAIDRVLELDPRREYAYDTRVMILAEVGRFDEAIAACSPPIFGDHPPIRLRGRAAWIERERGNHPRAVQLMREAVGDQASYEWGWAMLQEWAIADGDREAALEAGRRLVELAPRNGSSWWRLCESNLFAENRPEAIAALRRAIEVDPENATCAFNLFDLLLEDGAIEEARRSLATLETHHPGAFAAGRAIDLAIATADAESAQAMFGRICSDPGDSHWPLRDAFEKLAGAEWADAGRGVLRAALEQQTASARAALFLAEMHEQDGDLEGAIQALDYAHRLDPSWDTAARLLGGALQSAERFEEARVALDAAIAADPEDGRNHGFLADLHESLGDRVAAIEAMSEAVRRQPDYAWAWQQLDAWLAAEGRPGAVELALEIARTREHDAAAWAMAANRHPEEDLEGRIACLEKAVEIGREEISHHDQLAETLALAGRFQEAFAATRPAHLGVAVPRELRGREAWVHAQSGDLAAGMQAMRKVLTEEPDYRWGLACLGGWHEQVGEQTETLRLIGQIVEHHPDSPSDWSWLADVSVGTGDVSAARDAYTRACELAPEWEHPALSLFDLAWERGAHDDAEAALARLDAESLSEYGLGRLMQLLGRRKDWDQALEVFERICACCDESAWSVQTGWEVLDNRKCRKKRDAILLEAVEQGRAGTQTLFFFGYRYAQSVDSKAEPVLRRLLGDPASGFDVGRGFFDVCPVDRRFKKLLAENETFWRSDDRLWELVGMGYVRAEKFQQAYDWLADWRQRPAASATALVNLEYAMRALDRWKGLCKVCDAGLAAGHDYDAELLTWLAFEHAVQGRSKPSQRALESLERLGELDFSHQIGLALCHAVLEAQAGEHREARRLLRETSKRLRPTGAQAGLLNAFDRASRVLADRRGGFGARLRGGWQRWILRH